VDAPAGAGKRANGEASLACQWGDWQERRNTDSLKDKGLARHGDGGEQDQDKGRDKRALRGRAGRMQGGRGSGRTGGRGAGGAVRLWGHHAVEAALKNPGRNHRRLWATRTAVASLGGELPPDFPVEWAEAADLGRLVARDAPHQGLVLECDPLEDVWLEDVLDGDPARPVVVLDQVTDPHNLGAILRSAAAFDARAVVTQDRHAPPESGTLAKSASGALEIVPWVRVVNLSRALEEIAEAGYWRIALDGAGDITLREALPAGPVALVLGAEGEGIRQNVAQHCDAIARLPISAAMESLNVSNAASIALYAIATR
jgi:23S rRNA (guanosine2251-2'-O)-methyltransferase